MATLKEIRASARDLDRADDLVDSLQSRRAALQAELADINTKLDAAKTDRDTQKANFKTLVATLA